MYNYFSNIKSKLKKLFKKLNKKPMVDNDIELARILLKVRHNFTDDELRYLEGIPKYFDEKSYITQPQRRTLLDIIGRHKVLLFQQIINSGCNWSIFRRFVGIVSASGYLVQIRKKYPAVRGSRKDVI